MAEREPTMQMVRVLLASGGWYPIDVEQPVEIWENKGGKKCVLNNKYNKVRCRDATSWSLWMIPQEWLNIYQWIRSHS